MASQVLSGATNASYTNNTGQNVRLIINYMANVTSMTWAGVNVTAESTTIGKDIQNITGEFRGAETGDVISSTSSSSSIRYEMKLSNKKLDFLGVTTGVLYPSKSDSNSSGGLTRPLPRNYYPLQFTYGPATDTRLSTTTNIFYVPLTISRGGNFPVELMLAPNQQFSAVCGAFNAVVIKEDGT